MTPSLKSLWSRAVTICHSLAALVRSSIALVVLFPQVRLKISFSQIPFSNYHKCDVTYSFGHEHGVAHGVSGRPMVAILKAVSEFYERYVPIANVRDGALVEEVVRTVVPFGTAQIANVRCVSAVDLCSAEPAWLPAQCVRRYVSSIDANTGVVFPYTTNGSAAHPDKQNALAAGLLEVIERDALLCHWYGKKTPQKIDPDTIPERCAALVREFRTARITIEILDITTESKIPVICVIGSTTVGGETRRCISSGSNEGLEQAVEKALLEMIIVQWHLFRPFSKKYTTFDSISQDDRPKLWRGDLLAEFDWFRSGTQISFSEAQKRCLVFGAETVRVRALAASLSRVGVSAFGYEYVQSNAVSGLRVVKVVAPGLFPYFLRENQVRFGLSRLRRFCKRNDAEFAPYPFPHLLP